MIKTDKTTQPIENKGVAYLSVCLWNAGVADIIVLKAGRMICLEAKSPTGKQSPDQIIFERNIKANGGEYYLVRCVQDVLSAGI